MIMMKSQQEREGFSLIELLIVVAIILVISAIAIPSLLRARISANEASAVGSVRAINIGMIAYNNAYPTIGYAANLKSLGGAAPCTPKSNRGCLIDNLLATGTKSGYTFAASGTAGPPNPQYYASAVPVTRNITGVRSFCSIEDAVVRVQPSGAKVGNRNQCLPLGPIG
ncbi:MAG: type II secretion system protein [Terriglobales bacterium]|jgi:type IV pilus assembly protein PilA